MAARRSNRYCVFRLGCASAACRCSFASRRDSISVLPAASLEPQELRYNKARMIRKVGPYLLIGVVIVLAYLSFDWAVGAAIHNRKVVLVPDLSSKAVNDALNQLSPLGLGLEKEGEQFDKRFPA